MHHIDEETIGRKEEKNHQENWAAPQPPTSCLFAHHLGGKIANPSVICPSFVVPLEHKNGGDHRQGCFVCSGETREFPTSDLLSLVI